MLIGFITPDLKAVLRLRVLDAEEAEQECEVFVDTGFNGSLLLPRDFVARLGLVPHAESTARFADGHEATLEACRMKVWIGHQWQDVVILVSDGEPLLGMRLMLGHQLIAQIIDGGAVTIEPLN